MKGYLLLTAAIILEFLGTTSMKLSDGFEKIAYTFGILWLMFLLFSTIVKNNSTEYSIRNVGRFGNNPLSGCFVLFLSRISNTIENVRNSAYSCWCSIV